MSKYTTKLCNLIDEGYNIFNFHYPIFAEEYRKTFEEHFIEHFYFDEIGLETPDKFRQRLKIKLNLIMPYWNKVFLADNLEQRILDNYSVIETYKRNVKNDTIANTEQTNKNLASETPLEKVDFEQVDYFSSIVKDIGNNKSNVSGNSAEEWERTMNGNIGVQTDADAIVKYWESLRKIEIEIFNECSSLFMGVY